MPFQLNDTAENVVEYAEVQACREYVSFMATNVVDNGSNATQTMLIATGGERSNSLIIYTIKQSSVHKAHY